MNDITDHSWGDKDIKSCFKSDNDIVICIMDETSRIMLYKDDAIAIAKHFGIIQEIDGQRITIHKAEISLVPQSENTYASLNLDSVKTMKKTEVIGDSHG